MKENTRPPPGSQPSLSTSEPPILEPAVPARQVHRRHLAGFLAGLSMAMPLAASFSWLRPGRRSATPGPDQNPDPAPAAQPAPTAATALRPRLLVIVPEDTTQQYRLGHALGEYLNHGSDAALAPLAAVDLACIAAGEIDLPATAIGQGSLALLLVAGDTQRLVRFDLPEDDVNGRASETLADRVIDERIAIVSNAVRQAVIDRDQVVGVSPRMLARSRVQEIARRARAGYAIADWRTVSGLDVVYALMEGSDETGTPREPQAQSLMPDEAAHFAPALLAVALSVEGEARTGLMSTLAEVARRRVVRGEVPGAEWAKSSGCGLSFENREHEVAVACGMGHVPERSRRFLHFYTLKPIVW
jgi:hypothetical protein